MLQYSLALGQSRPAPRPVKPTACGREREQAALSVVVEEFGRKGPAVVTVAGRPGFGQNTLVRLAAELAAGRGLRVMRARATQSEAGLAHGVTAQLLSTPDAPGAAEGPVQLPGLSWVLRSARDRPTVLAVEDAQWLDPESLRWLHALVLRSAGLPVALLCGGDEVSDTEADWLVLACPAPGLTVHHYRLPPLGHAEVASVVAHSCDRWGDEGFVAEAWRITGGHPGVLHDTLRQFTWHGHRPVEAQVPELRAICAVVTGDHLLRAVRGLSAEAVAVIRALAVCGDVLDFRVVCALAGLSSLGESRLRALLSQVPGISWLPGTGPRVDPAVRARMLEEMTAGGRADLYGRAAELAHRAGVCDLAVAGLLLGAPPVGAPWAVRTLRAGAVAVRQQDHRRAVAFLTRALEEDPAPAVRAELALDLAAADLVEEPEAGDRWLDEIIRGHGRRTAPRAAAADLGLTGGGTAVVRRAVAEALPGADGAERDDLLALYWCADPTGQEDTALLVPDVPPLPRRPLPPAQAGVRAWQLALRGRDVDLALDLARLALGRHPGGEVLLQPRLAACKALCLADHHDEAEAGLDRLLRESSGSRADLAAPQLLAVRAAVNLRRGRLAAAERDVTAAEQGLRRLGRSAPTAAQLRSLRILVDLECGRQDRAEALARLPLPAEAERSDSWPNMLFAQGLVALGAGRPEEAAQLLRECGRRLLARHCLNPALLPWRSAAALALHVAGEREEARRLGEQEILLARRWGTATALGWAQLCADQVADRAGRRDRVRATLDVLREGPAGPGYVRALAEHIELELADADGDRESAAATLAELTVLTATYPAGPMAVRARALAGALENGARPAPRPAPRWPDLSPPERQTAVLAGRGHSNRDIAATLSVSSRAVEFRLHRAYHKLGIKGRPELQVLVRAMEGS
ncbi:AAA family ATPase [Kitasatospora sp. NPDC049258]|uniref:helix-turn-helix transcriptional regulator n=1 Tax=Kitasatospora sp. NPDC049258 TaxID=3155394 RepID=UPI003413E3D9